METPKSAVSLGVFTLRDIPGIWDRVKHQTAENMPNRLFLARLVNGGFRNVWQFSAQNWRTGLEKTGEARNEKSPGRLRDRGYLWRADNRTEAEAAYSSSDFGD